MVKVLYRKGQEEIVGFALIVIIVAVVILLLLAFSLRDDDSQDFGDSYEVESFLQASLQTTTTCRDNSESLSIQNLVFSCQNRESCSDGRESCEVLRESLEEKVTSGWPFGAARPVKGYELIVLSNEEILLELKGGNSTGNFKGSLQSFSQGSNSIDIAFRAFY